MDSIAERYASVLERLERAAQRGGRRREAITLISVTKSWSAAVVVEAYEAGMRHFGENRPEELATKRAEVEAHLGLDNGIIWHQIGPLQSRKTALAAEHADLFHALDRLKIANRLSQQLSENDRELPVFMEVNISGESSKSGLPAHNWEEDKSQREELRQMVATIATMPGLLLWGLMTMAPWDAPEAVIRAVFRRTRLLAEWLQPYAPRPLALSMGMSDDFEIAVEEGASHVRVGRAIFGERNSN
jgi:pyridoxal phosphate enzyme (YggS family)